MCVYAGGEEEEPAQRVSNHRHLMPFGADSLTLTRAKYIEGLENRLGRMESLLRLSGTSWKPPVAIFRAPLVLLSESSNTSRPPHRG